MTRKEAYTAIGNVTPDFDWLEKYMTDYYHSDDIAVLSDYSKFIDGEYDYNDDDDYKMIQEFRQMSLKEFIEDYNEHLLVCIKDALNNIANQS